MTEPAAPSSAGLKKKIAGVPTWMLAAALVAGVALYLFYKHRRDAAAASTSPGSASGTVGVPGYATTGDLALAGLYQPPAEVTAGNIAGPQGLQGPAGAPGVPGPAATAADPTKPGPGLPVGVPVPPATTPAAPAQSIAPSATGQTPPPQRYVTVTPWPSKTSTLWGIAQQSGISLAQIEALNPQIPNPSLVYAGQGVRVA